jgi:hypothetical protein
VRRSLPLALGTLAGLVVLVSRFAPWVRGTPLEQTADRWIVTSEGAAVLLGVVSLVRVHLEAVLLRPKDRPYSLILLGAMFGYGGLVLWEGPDGPAARWVFLDVLSPLYSTMYALIAFFVTSAAYRAFRVRSGETAVLLASAAVVMIGLTPLGDALVSGWGRLADWVLDVPVTGAYRAIQLGATLGALTTALRILLGLERAHLGGLGGG